MQQFEPEARVLTVKGRKYLVTKRNYTLYMISSGVLAVYVLTLVLFSYLKLDTTVLWYLFLPVFILTMASNTITFRSARKLSDEEALKYRTTPAGKKEQSLE
jgi:hypothetical protein